MQLSTQFDDASNYDLQGKVAKTSLIMSMEYSSVPPFPDLLYY